MKKFLSLLILIVSSFVCFACGEEPIISYAKNSITINIDESYMISDNDINIENYDGEYRLVILDENIAQIDGMKIIPKRSGKTYLRIQLDKRKYYLDIELKITNNISATSVFVEHNEVSIDLNETQTIVNKISLNQGCNEVPQVIIDNDIITYDYKTGIINAMATGTATVQVKFKACSITFRVKITGVIYTKEFNISDVEMYEGQDGKFEYSVFPLNANTYYFTSDSDLIDVNYEGSYVAKLPGRATVTVKYKTSENSEFSKSFNVRILEKDIDFNISITDENGNNVSKFYKENQYIISISGIDQITRKELAEISNIAIVKKEINSDNIIIDFYFLSTGELTLNFDFYIADTMVAEKDMIFKVFSFDDYTIRAKWITSTILPDSNGNYHIYLNSDGLNTYISFSLYFQGQKLDTGYEIEQPDKTKVSNTFKPTETGVYELSFVVDNCIVKKINVIVS